MSSRPCGGLFGGSRTDKEAVLGPGRPPCVTADKMARLQQQHPFNHTPEDAREEGTGNHDVGSMWDSRKVVGNKSGGDNSKASRPLSPPKPRKGNKTALEPRWRGVPLGVLGRARSESAEQGDAAEDGPEGG